MVAGQVYDRWMIHTVYVWVSVPGPTGGRPLPLRVVGRVTFPGNKGASCLNQTRRRDGDGDSPLGALPRPGRLHGLKGYGSGTVDDLLPDPLPSLRFSFTTPQDPSPVVRPDRCPAKGLSCLTLPSVRTCGTTGGRTVHHGVPTRPFAVNFQLTQRPPCLRTRTIGLVGLDPRKPGPRNLSSVRLHPCPVPPGKGVP